MTTVHPFELTRQLMAIPSVTGGEGEIARFLATLLSSQGYRVETQTVEGDRSNVIAYAGEPDLMFCTHIDTVPPELPVSEDESALYGRGACDTKGIIAAMIEAGGRLRAAGIDRFGFLLVVGEETGGDGAKAANARKWTTRYVVVGEPTDNRLARAQKGTLMAALTVKGTAAHSGYPEAGRSAVDPLVDILYECARTHWGEDPVLGRGTFNAGVLRAGERANIIAGEATATVMLRTVEAPEAARSRLARVVRDRASIEVLAGAAPQYMHTVAGFPETVVSFGSDVPYLGNLGKPLLVGPGSILDAHTPGEKITKEALLEGVDLYVRLARTLLA